MVRLLHRIARANIRRAHLSEFTGTLQADGYAGFEQIYEDGRIQEAACWAHVRRKFYDLQVAHKFRSGGSAERIAALCIEDEIRGRPPKNVARSATRESAVAGIAETMARETWGSSRENPTQPWLFVMRWDDGKR